jgi:hypothetical protein
MRKRTPKDLGRWPLKVSGTFSSTILASTSPVKLLRQTSTPDAPDMLEGDSFAG